MQIYISYADQDQDVAKEVAKRLSEAGYAVWYSAVEILPGDNWGLKVGEALEESEAMVVLLSPAALRSSRVRDEISFALGAVNYCDRLIPVQITSVNIDRVPRMLREQRVVRYGPTNRDRAIREIVERLQQAPV